MHVKEEKIKIGSSAEETCYVAEETCQLTEETCCVAARPSRRSAYPFYPPINLSLTLYIINVSFES